MKIRSKAPAHLDCPKTGVEERREKRVEGVHASTSGNVVAKLIKQWERRTESSLSLDDELGEESIVLVNLGDRSSEVVSDDE